MFKNPTSVLVQTTTRTATTTMLRDGARQLHILAAAPFVLHPVRRIRCANFSRKGPILKRIAGQSTRIRCQTLVEVLVGEEYQEVPLKLGGPIWARMMQMILILLAILTVPIMLLRRKKIINNT
jgi:hypothetical protein